MLVAGDVVDFTADRLEQLEERTAAALSIEVSRVTVTAAAASVRLTTTITTQSASGAIELEAQYRADVGEDAATVGDTLGETVESSPSFEHVSYSGTGGSDESPILVAVGCAAVLVVVVLCVAALFCRHREKIKAMQRKQLDTTTTTTTTPASPAMSAPQKMDDMMPDTRYGAESDRGRGRDSDRRCSACMSMMPAKSRGPRTVRGGGFGHGHGHGQPARDEQVRGGGGWDSTCLAAATATARPKVAAAPRPRTLQQVSLSSAALDAAIDSVRASRSADLSA